MKTQAQIFEGIKVLDFTQVIAGSYATTILGDMGAEVVKIEPPGHGDTLRLAGPMYKGESGFFLLNNRNKKSVSLDLKKPESIELIKKLIPQFDIVTQNFKPGVMEKLGLGYEDLKKVKEDIIYVSISGYGLNNAYSNRPAYDNIIQGHAGLMALNGRSDNHIPMRSPLSISDYTVGIYSALAMASAVYHHEKTGEGQFVDLAMYDSLISIMDNSFLIAHLNHQEIERLSDDREEFLEKIGILRSGNRHPGAAPHGVYKTQDGHIAHMSLTNRMWHALLEIIGREDLIGDPYYEVLDNRKADWKQIDEMIERWSETKTSEEVLRIFQEHKLPCEKIRNVHEVITDPQSDERGIFAEVEHKTAGRIKITNVPIKFSRTPTKIHSPSPLLGEHNREILGGMLGFSDETIDSLVREGVVFEKKVDIPVSSAKISLAKSAAS